MEGLFLVKKVASDSATLLGVVLLLGRRLDWWEVVIGKTFWSG